MLSVLLPSKPTGAGTGGSHGTRACLRADMVHSHGAHGMRGQVRHHLPEASVGQLEAQVWHSTVCAGWAGEGKGLQGMSTGAGWRPQLSHAWLCMAGFWLRSHSSTRAHTEWRSTPDALPHYSRGWWPTQHSLFQCNVHHHTSVLLQAVHQHMHRGVVPPGCQALQAPDSRERHAVGQHPAGCTLSVSSSARRLVNSCKWEIHMKTSTREDS